MRDAAFSLSYTVSFIYFSILAILGQTHSTNNDGSFFVFIVILPSVVSLLYIFGGPLLKSALPIPILAVFFYILPLIVGFFYLIEWPSYTESNRYFLFFLIFSAPSIYIGSFVARHKLLKMMFKWFDPIIVILSLGLIFSLPKIVFQDEVSVGGAGYQSISYMASFAFSLTLFSLFFGSYFARFKVFTSKIFLAVFYLFLFIQLASVFLSGGRGGFIVVLLSSIILVFIRFYKKLRFIRFFLSIFLVAATFIILSEFLPREVENILMNGADRIFSYITFEGIDMTATSGRDIVYANAWKLIVEKPILGYGFFKYVDLTKTYPHNIILEFLLQGGILYLLLWIYLFWKLVIKYLRMIKIDNTNLFLIPLGIFPITQLLFSGSYIMSNLFWFVVVYIFSYKTR